MSTSQIIIGLVGEPSGGKDAAAMYLVEKYDFVHVSTGDLVRDYIRDNNLGNLSRKNLNRVATKLREQFGPDYLATTAMQNTKVNRVVISGLRTVAEVHSLQLNKAVILCVNANIKTRYKRAKLRGRIGEHIDFDTFKRIQKSEEKAQSPDEPNVDAVISIADESIQNDGTLDQLHTQIDEFMTRLNKKN